MISRLVHRVLLRLMPWYDEGRHLASIEAAVHKVEEAEDRRRDSVIRAEAARARSRIVSGG